MPPFAPNATSVDRRLERGLGLLGQRDTIVGGFTVDMNVNYAG